MKRENMQKFMTKKTLEEFLREYSDWIIKADDKPESYDILLIHTHLMDFLRENFVDRKKLILSECELPEEGKNSRQKFYHLSVEEYEKQFGATSRKYE